MKRNLDHSALPGAEEIRLYQEGKLSPARTHEIELMAEENPMLGDALEGYAALPLFGAVPGVTAAVSQQAASSSTGFGTTTSAIKSGSAWWHLNGWVIGVGVGVSAAVIATVMLREDSPSAQSLKSEKSIHQQEEALQTPRQEDKTTNYQVQQNKTKSEFLPAAELTAKGSSASNSLISESVVKESELNRSPRLESAEIPASSPTSMEMGVVTPFIESPVLQSAATLKPGNTTLVAVSIIRYKDYRLADYAQLRKSEWEFIKLDEVGLPASFESSAEKNDDLSKSDKIGIPYVAYIKSNIDAYDKKEYRTAIAGFLNVLKQYPDDINAQFYGAMSYFNHDQPVLALQMLEKAEKNPINTFREEIQFYKAKCLKMLNRTEESTTIFSKIVTDNGFYKSHAQKELLD